MNGRYFKGKIFYNADELGGEPNHHFQLVAPGAADKPEVAKVIKELKEEVEDINSTPNVHPSFKEKAKRMKEAVQILQKPGAKQKRE